MTPLSPKDIEAGREANMSQRATRAIMRRLKKPETVEQAVRQGRAPKSRRGRTISIDGHLTEKQIEHLGDQIMTTLGFEIVP